MSNWYEVKWRRTLAHPVTDYDRHVENSGQTGAWGNSEKEAIDWVVNCVGNAGTWNVFIEGVTKK